MQDTYVIVLFCPKTIIIVYYYNKEELVHLGNPLCLSICVHM
uniref:Uncharacterized protein n=1 Tax=Amphimedon queenslandica TaxID=400682 RepID=A0A1X7V6V0_AMPQE